MDDFYHADVVKSLTADPSGFLDDSDSKPDPTIYLKVSSILFVRAGLFLSQVSSIPSSNIQILIFQNIIDIAVNTVIYSLVGYLLAFGKDVGSFIGIDGFLSDRSNRNEFAEGWLIIIAVSGLVVAAIGDRISFFASLIINVLISGLVFPMIIHWTLTDRGWMRRHTFAAVKVSYKDYSYSCLIHMSGGFLAFLGMLVLNKRLLRFKDMDVCSIPDNGPSLTLFGNFFMILGFLGVGIPTEKYLIHHLDFNFYGIVMVNMLLSAFGAVISTLFLTFSCPCEPMHKWTSMRSIQAGISGIAVIAGGADVYYPIAALMVGLCNGFLFFLISFLVNISPIEDYSNIIACHFVSGFVGTLLPPVLGIREGFNKTFYLSFMHLAWQFLCDLALMGLIFAAFVPITFILDYCSILRSWDEDINHRRALFASKSIKNEPPRTFEWQNQDQNEAYIEPERKQRERSPQSDSPPEAPKEKVDILFEKKPSPTGPGDDGKEASVNSDFLLPCMTTDKANEVFAEGKVRFENEKYLVNYVLNSKPLTFFEEINSDSRRTSDTVVKDSGDNYGKNSKFFDIKLIRGIRNISDSKLFHKFKDNWTIPKKRTAWSRERELRFGSMSNIWCPSPVGISLETQV